MAEGLTTLDGQPVDLDASEAQFAAAMAAPAADRPGMAAPPRKPPEPAPDPENAPYGWTWTEDEWRPKKRAGRPRSQDKARVTETPPASPSPPPMGAAPAAPRSKPDFRQALGDTVEAAWFALAAVPIPDQAFGFKLTGLRTNLRVQAALLAQNADGLVAGVNAIGQHNKFVARGLARLQSGEAGLWVLPAVMALAPFVAATGQLWSGQLAEASLEELATATEQSAQAYLEQMAKAATGQPAAGPAAAT